MAQIERNTAAPKSSCTARTGVGYTAVSIVAIVAAALISLWWWR